MGKKTKVIEGKIYTRLSAPEHLLASIHLRHSFAAIEDLLTQLVGGYGPNNTLTLQTKTVMNKINKINRDLGGQFWYEHPKETVNPYVTET